jgi:hypothetical protein
MGLEAVRLINYSGTVALLLTIACGGKTQATFSNDHDAGHGGASSGTQRASGGAPSSGGQRSNGGTPSTGGRAAGGAQSSGGRYTGGAPTFGSGGLLPSHDAGASGGVSSGGVGPTIDASTGGVSTGCSASEKLCNGTCVRYGPSNGCAASSCSACPTQPPANGVLGCNAQGECDFVCLSGFTRTGSACVASTGTAGDGGVVCSGQVCTNSCPLSGHCCNTSNQCACMIPLLGCQ